MRPEQEYVVSRVEIVYLRTASEILLCTPQSIKLMIIVSLNTKITHIVLAELKYVAPLFLGFTVVSASHPVPK